MKPLLTVGVLSILVGVTAVAQDAPSPARPAGRSNPNIVSPRATPGLRPPDAPALPYHFVTQPAPMPGQKFGNVSGVALTPQGHLLVYNRNPAMMMVEYDAQGKFLRTFNPNIAINTHGMRVDRYGNIWILDHFLNVLWKLKPNGEPVMSVGTRGEVAKWDDAKWNGMFNQGHGGTAGPPDCTYCSTYNTAKPPVTQGSDPRVFKFDKSGKYISSRGLPHADGTCPTIHSVIVTPKGELWVTDRQMGKILVLDTNLSPLREIQQPNLTSGLFVDAKGHIWMSSGMDGMIMSLDDNGKIIGWLGKGGRDADGATSNLIGEAHYLVVTRDQQTIYIADSVNAKVLKLERD